LLAPTGFCPPPLSPFAWPFQVLEFLDNLAEPGSEEADVRNEQEVVLRLVAAVASKQFGRKGCCAHSLLTSVLPPTPLPQTPSFQLAQCMLSATGG